MILGKDMTRQNYDYHDYDDYNDCGVMDQRLTFSVPQARKETCYMVDTSVEV